VYGFDQIYQFISNTLWPYLDEFVKTDCKSYKSLIQERSQGNGLPLPSYITTEISKNGEIWFHSELQINGVSYGIGEGKNKKKSQEQAAQNAYEHRKEKNKNL